MTNFFKNVAKHFSATCKSIKNHIKNPKDRMSAFEATLYGLTSVVAMPASIIGYGVAMFAAPGLTLAAHAVMAAGIYGAHYWRHQKTDVSVLRMLGAPFIAGYTLASYAAVAVNCALRLVTGTCGALIKGTLDTVRDKTTVRAETPVKAPEASAPAALPAPVANDFNLNGGIIPEKGDVLRVKVEQVKKDRSIRL